LEHFNELKPKSFSKIPLSLSQKQQIDFENLEGGSNKIKKENLLVKH
jgi:hypothetical protein